MPKNKGKVSKRPDFRQNHLQRIAHIGKTDTDWNNYIGW